MSGVYEQTVARHTWTPTMEDAAMCGDCPECGKQGQHTHTEFSGGDGERGYVEYDCTACGTSWTDSYNLVSRTVYPALRDVGVSTDDDRETIWIDGVETKLYSVAEGLEIMAEIHRQTVARERIAEQDAADEAAAIEYLRA